MNENSRNGAVSGGVASVGEVRHATVLPPLALAVIVGGAWAAFDIWVEWLVGLFPDRIAGIATLDDGLTVASWTVGTWLAIRLVNVYFWRGLVERRNGRPVPKLMVDILAGAITAAALGGLLVTVGGMSPAMVGASVAGLVVFVALFLKRPLDDLFAGLSLHVDPAVNIGDLVAVGDDKVGTLEEITWRSTRLTTRDGNRVIVPNSVIANTTLTNMSSPDPIMVAEITATLDFVVPIDRGVRVMQAALQAAIGSGGIMATPKPVAGTDGPNAYGIVYRLRFHYDFAKSDETRARTAVMQHLMVHLFSAGLAFALPKENLFLGRVRMRQMDWMRPPDRKTLLGGNILFGELDDHELDILTDGMKVHRYKSSDDVIRQGERDTSMFGLAEGLLEVRVQLEREGESAKVAEIEPGGFFGEMSLLAGEPRSATVTTLMESVIYEVTRESVVALLLARPEIGETLSRVVAQRQIEMSNIVETANNQEREDAISKTADTLLGRMAAVFGEVLKRRA